MQEVLPLLLRAGHSAGQEKLHPEVRHERAQTGFKNILLAKYPPIARNDFNKSVQNAFKLNLYWDKKRF